MDKRGDRYMPDPSKCRTAAFIADRRWQMTHDADGDPMAYRYGTEGEPKPEYHVAVHSHGRVLFILFLGALCFLGLLLLLAL